ncbi:MAG: hypothetical protein HeimC2_33400 [Candidatus Heimdallarchaeota archaeon LC_2]|nr:MAG: hypothetical protein HeimC2_33400 [Candidatus Heimdallarchaeota archaeon LC_2]
MDQLTKPRRFKKSFLLLILIQYKPDAILVSLGLDALEDDPYGVLSMTPDGYFEIGKRIGEAGTGSGALTSYLSQIVGPTGGD